MECFVISLLLTFCSGVFRGNPAQVKEYEELLQAVIFQSFEGNFWTHTHAYAHLLGQTVKACHVVMDSACLPLSSSRCQ